MASASEIENCWRSLGNIHGTIYILKLNITQQADFPTMAETTCRVFCITAIARLRSELNRVPIAILAALTDARHGR